MQAKEFLSRKQVAFEYIETSTLANPVETIRAVTGGALGTPVMVIDDDFIVGFDPAWIDARLDSHG